MVSQSVFILCCGFFWVLLNGIVYRLWHRFLYRSIRLNHHEPEKTAGIIQHDTIKGCDFYPHLLASTAFFDKKSALLPQDMFVVFGKIAMRSAWICRRFTMMVHAISMLCISVPTTVQCNRMGC